MRAVSSRTCDFLPAIARVAQLIHPELELADRVSRLRVRLELGVPGGAVDIARHAGARLTRGDYQDLLKAELNNQAAIDAASEDKIPAGLGGNETKAQVVREAAAAIRDESQLEAALLPDYKA